MPLGDTAQEEGGGQQEDVNRTSIQGRGRGVWPRRLQRVRERPGRESEREEGREEDSGGRPTEKERDLGWIRSEERRFFTFSHFI